MRLTREETIKLLNVLNEHAKNPDEPTNKGGKIIDFMQIMDEKVTESDQN